MISRSREDDSMRCPWESEETGGLSWAESACWEGEVKSMDQNFHKRYAHSSSVVESTGPICGRFVNMHRNVTCACVLTAYGRMITSMAQIYSRPISKPFETWLCGSSHLYFSLMRSAMWFALADGKSVDLKHAKALAYLCSVSCPFVCTLRTCLAHVQSWTTPAIPAKAIWAHATHGQPMDEWVLPAKPRRIAWPSAT